MEVGGSASPGGRVNRDLVSVGVRVVVLDVADGGQHGLECDRIGCDWFGRPGFGVWLGGHAVCSLLGLSSGFRSAVLVCVPVSYTHLRAHETDSYLVCRLLLEK